MRTRPDVTGTLRAKNAPVNRQGTRSALERDSSYASPRMSNRTMHIALLAVVGIVFIWSGVAPKDIFDALDPHHQEMVERLKKYRVRMIRQFDATAVLDQVEALKELKGLGYL